MAQRSALIAHLRERGILSVFHYIPLHLSPVGAEFGYSKGHLPVTEEMSERLLQLPFYFEIQEEDIWFVCREICGFYEAYFD